MPFDPSKLDFFPAEPGVYLMKGKDQAVLYVGKAKNLRQRIKQYFFPGRDGRSMVPFLIAQVETIDTIVVTSEKEALLVENNLIKQHVPKYNALLKDDKNFIAIKLTTRSKWPQVQLVRYRGKPKADGLYFGPYTSAYAARKTLDLIQRVFPLRQCTDQEFSGRSRPCILHEMGRCIAPCVARCTEEEYARLVERVIKFLKGQDKELLQELYQEMELASQLLEYEKAGSILHMIRQIEKTVEQQRVDKPFGGDVDALGIYRQAEEVIVALLEFRGGKLLGSKNYDFTKIAEDNEELLTSFLLQHYRGLHTLPHEILLPQEMDGIEVIADIIRGDEGKKIHIHSPCRGEKKALIDMAVKNAHAAYHREKDESEIRERTLLQMQEALRLSHFPRKIECVDNSNISGSAIVSSLVVFSDGKPDRSQYRKYKIRTIDVQDDYAALREVLQRRYSKAKERSGLPDLIIVDGGKGHLNAAIKVLQGLDIVAIDVIGVAKESARHDKGMTNEQIFLPNVKDPLILNRHSHVLHLLQQIRDEAHRTAISFHRGVRSKKTVASALDTIQGIGPVKKNKLLKHFGSVKQLKLASRGDLELLSFLSKTNIDAILSWSSENA